MTQRLEGGTRLTGQSPVVIPELPVVTVITVVFNSAGLIEKTIGSVLNQTYPNIEYVIIDGGSGDGTVELIRKYEDRIAWWISEPDHGLYDAMNKGLAAATGDYVWFLNSGDLIYEKDTVEKVLEEGRRQKAEGQREGRRQKAEGQREGRGQKAEGRRGEAVIFYGDTMIVDAEYRELGLRRLRPPEELTSGSFQKGMLVCHQAILVHRSIAEPFNLKYKHSADFDWVIKAIRRAEGQMERQKAEGRRQKERQKAEGKRQKERQKACPGLDPGAKVSFIVNTRLILCAFLDGGHSKQNIPASLRERFEIMSRNYGLVPTVLRHIPIALRFLWFWGRKGRF